MTEESPTTTYDGDLTSSTFGSKYIRGIPNKSHFIDPFQ